MAAHEWEVAERFTGDRSLDVEGVDRAESGLFLSGDAGHQEPYERETRHGAPG